MKTPELSACHELEALLPAYVEHSLPAAEADRVAAHLPTCPACQLQVTQLRALTDDLDAALPEVPRTALRANFMAMLEEQKALLPTAAASSAPAPAQPEAKVVSMWPTAVANNWMRIAASIVLIAAGVFLGRQLPWGGRANDSVATTSEADKNTRYALAQALAGDNGRTVSASDRIRLVTNSPKESEPGDPTVQVLINTLNFDPNPNVRLAACEALYRLRDDPRVREGLANSLPIQTDPNVQIALIDMVVSMRVRRAVPQLERLAKRPDALPVVRAQAEAGIGKLI
ncbi:HEAT repeat domain-containing protein [Hymenobacter sp. BT770]|uniref:HEAT repeat domain-containing protein n=1 Tax=Hymenobacter sp. BT770 TaxID=2886942 RepID=UPI001D0FD124|nr:HEAT repeat domain-containing protein [Hymenobacter sp. BT770]MCC3151632.1 HEAT repeat domain-containing protein [Hymenobacter sp. BT770]MDO3413791.1 HEAT repeat domain-containing protein [Hymenobacter sp. BT770]